jgi:ubiquinone/menaquinone biosynthesis C-methylase UbiE
VVHTANLSPHYERYQRQVGDKRKPDRLIAHYELERRLADRLRASSRHERRTLYTELYSELFASLPDHPQNIKTTRSQSARTANQVRLLHPMLTPDCVYLELGCGDAAVTFALAKLAATTIGVDVTDSLIDFSSAPPNFLFVRTSGVEISLTDNSVDLAYSNQLIEHLHVDDVEDHLREMARVLKPGGRYVCATPNRVTGPHDISYCFDETATGFHLREYDYGSIRALFQGAGFNQVRFAVVVRGRRLSSPPYPMLRLLELALLKASNGFRRRAAELIKPLMGITAIATR